MLSERLAKALGMYSAPEALAVGVNPPDVSQCPQEQDISDGGGMPLEQVFEVLTRHARLKTGADGVALALAGSDGVVCRASCGQAPDRGVKLDPHSGLCGQCFSNREPVMWTAKGGNSACGMSSVLAVPICEAENAQGLIAAFSYAPNAFKIEHLAAMTRIARIVTEHLASESGEFAPVAAPILAVQDGCIGAGSSDGSDGSQVWGAPWEAAGSVEASLPTSISAADRASYGGDAAHSPLGSLPGPQEVGPTNGYPDGLTRAVSQEHEDAAGGASPNTHFDFEKTVQVRRNYMVPLVALVFVLIVCALFCWLSAPRF